MLRSKRERKCILCHSDQPKVSYFINIQYIKPGPNGCACNGSYQLKSSNPHCTPADYEVTSIVPQITDIFRFPSKAMVCPLQRPGPFDLKSRERIAFCRRENGSLHEAGRLSDVSKAGPFDIRRRKKALILQ